MLRQAYGHFFDLTIVNNDIGETISALESAIEKVHSTPQWIPVSWLYWQDSELEQELAESCDECIDDECDCEYCDINESNYETKWGQLKSTFSRNERDGGKHSVTFEKSTNFKQKR